MNYRKEIDGLRSIAIVPVILFHAGVPGFSGGYLGVDIFFVISGFLITNILLSNLENDNFSIATFYEKRCRRILPALFFMLVITTALSTLLLSGSQFKAYSQSLFAVASFSSNILFWLDSGYFDSSAELKPLLHTWSLGVEEQYYIVAPLLLWAAFKLGRLSLYTAFLFFTFISLGLAEYMYIKDPNANFYLLPTRAWEMSIGSLAALCDRHFQIKSRDSLATVGFAAAVIPLFIFNEHTPTPSLITLIPVCGVALMLLFARKQSIVGRFLSTAPLVWVGLMSYSAYLWHQPLFAFSRLTSFEEPPLYWFALMTCLTFGLAYFSWKFVEQPFRDRNIISTKSMTRFSIFGLLCCLIFGLAGHLHSEKMVVGTLNPLHTSIAKYESDNVKLRSESWSVLRNITADQNYVYAYNPADEKLWFDNADTRIGLLVVGNSHSKDMFNILHFSDFNESYQLARYGVQIRELSNKHSFYASPNYNFADVIFITSQFNEADLANLENVIQRVHADKKSLVITTRVSEFPDFAHGAATLSDKLIVENKESFDNKALSEFVNEQYFILQSGGATNNNIYSINKELIRLVSAFDNITLLERDDYFCNTQAETCFALGPQLQKFTYDFTHHSLDGAKYYAERIKKLKWKKIVEDSSK